MASTSAIEFVLPDESSTQALGAMLARAIVGLTAPIAADGLAVGLQGDLGAGKTALVRALLRSLGVQGTVKSPSYALLEPYEVLKLNFYHFDFYRFKSPQEFAQAGFAEYFGAGKVCFVEWPERAQGFLPPLDCRIDLRIEDGKAQADRAPPRHASIRGTTPIGEQCVAILRDLRDPTRAGA